MDGSEVEAKKLALEGRALVGKPEMRDSRHPEHEATMQRYYEIQKQLQKWDYEGILDPRLASDVNRF